MTDSHYIQRKLSIPVYEAPKEIVPLIKLLGTTGKGYSNCKDLAAYLKLIEEQRWKGDTLDVLNVYDGKVYRVVGKKEVE